MYTPLLYCFPCGICVHVVFIGVQVHVLCCETRVLQQKGSLSEEGIRSKLRQRLLVAGQQECRNLGILCTTDVDTHVSSDVSSAHV